MIDHSRKPLARIEAFGFFWHGYYDGAWRNRAGAVMSGFPPSAPLGAIATAKQQLGNIDAQLVNFGMPTVSTPTAEASVGMERWNKNVLHGYYRAPGIFSTKGFSQTGWPYRASDGTVWFLRMSATGTNPNYCQVKAIKLTAAFAVPTTVIASILVPNITDGTAGAVDTVTFSPDGTKAAAHSFYSNFPLNDFVENSQPGWIVEAAVSGGSASAAPTVSLSLTDLRADDDPSLLTSPTVPVLNIVWTQVGGTTYEAIDATHRWALTEFAPSLVAHPTNVRDLYSTAPLIGYRRHQILICYGTDGSRKSLTWEMATQRKNNDRVIASSQNQIIAQYESLSGSWGAWGVDPSQKQPGWYITEYTTEYRHTTQLLRNKTTVVSFDAQSSQIFQASGSAYSGNLNGPTYPTPTGTAPIGTSYPLVYSGNGWTGVGTTLADDADLQIRRMSTNIVSLLIGSVSVPFRYYGWAGPISDGQYGISTPFNPSDHFFPAIHPETGAFAAGVRLYF